MITEANYVELLKNCAKWNERTAAERRSRLYYYDQQTGTAHRPVANYYKTPAQRHTPLDPNAYLQYSAPRWRKRDHQPSDAVEMKMFLRDNPQLDAAINQTIQPQTLPEVAAAEISMDFGMMSSKGTPKQNIFDDYTDDLDDDLSNGSGSDEDDWGSKRKKGKNAMTKKKKNTARGSKSSRN